MSDTFQGSDIPQSHYFQASLEKSFQIQSCLDIIFSAATQKRELLFLFKNFRNSGRKSGSLLLTKGHLSHKKPLMLEKQSVELHYLKTRKIEDNGIPSINIFCFLFCELMMASGLEACSTVLILVAMHYYFAKQSRVFF